MTILSESTVIEAFKTTAYFTNYMVLAVFLIRVVYAQITVQPQHIFREIIKGLVTYYILIIFFPLLISVMYKLPESIAELVSKHGPRVEKSDAISWDFLPDIFKESWNFWVITFDNAGRFVDTAFLTIMAFAGPIVFFTSCMFGLMSGVAVFMGVLIISMISPMISGLLDCMMLLIQSNTDNIVLIAVSEVLTAFLKLVLPMFFGGFFMVTSVGKAFMQSVHAIVVPPSRNTVSRNISSVQVTSKYPGQSSFDRLMSGNSPRSTVGHRNRSVVTVSSLNTQNSRADSKARLLTSHRSSHSARSNQQTTITISQAPPNNTTANRKA